MVAIYMVRNDRASRGREEYLTIFVDGEERRLAVRERVPRRLARNSDGSGTSLATLERLSCAGGPLASRANSRTESVERDPNVRLSLSGRI